ncbi:hypothetical protein E7744_15135 (plasmid) [Citricoccus sp. SGAir0253]|uniref:hypothetical protein n=1 Tax=Citricoccus sp. SGAir0253 TaxID=2567881 RepID=UPI0010CD2252|nr:hypothetical protein [Citricoccus sp. SGAir0253]QCU79645.1 hypothetical protein E7744_15135 [Citricoccus sp. SGAir0253]
MAWAKRAGGTGTGTYGSGTTAEGAGTPVVDPPAFSATNPAVRAPYRREPYVRAQLPDRGAVDAKALFWSGTHVLIHWQVDHGVEVHNAWIPASWVTRIRPEDSSWQDPYDQPGP